MIWDLPDALMGMQTVNPVVDHHTKLPCIKYMDAQKLYCEDYQ